MGTDNSEPRIGRIVFVGAFVVVVLLSARAGLVAYFDIVSRAEEVRKVLVSRPESRLNIEAEESRQLHSGPLPIDRAMNLLSVRGRLGASREINPEGSKDTSPLMGWMQMPATVPGPMAEELDASTDAPQDGGSASTSFDAAGPVGAAQPGMPAPGRGTASRPARGVP
jgi:hypothetical protein